MEENKGPLSSFPKEMLPKKPGTYLRYSVVLLASVATITNYTNRIGLSVTASELQKVFHISATEMGIAFAVFYWAYFMMNIPAGMLLNKYGPRFVLGFGCLGWGLVGWLFAGIQGFGTLIACRILLGITQATDYPSCARMVSVWVPARERTFATACFDCCASIGSALTPPLVAFIMVLYGWRAAFIVTGSLSVIWSIFILLKYREPWEHPRLTKAELDWIRQDEVISEEGNVVSKPIPVLKLFTYPAVLKVCLGYGMMLYVWTVFGTWMPSYLVQARGLSITAMGIGAMIPYICSASAELVGSYFFDKWVARGVSITKVRRTTLGVCMTAAGVFTFLTMQANSAVMAITFISLTMSMITLCSGSAWAIPSDIAPYGQAGGMGGVYNAFGNIFSMSAPIITGLLVDSRFGYNGAFAVCVIAAIIGAVFFAVARYERLEPKEY